MPDQRRHRGPHPEDYQLFAAESLPQLQAATCDLSWLLSRGYALTSALKIVGDRYSLTARQRLAVARCACADDQLARRKQHQTPSSNLRDHELWIDGYNVLTSIEAALAGGVILHARDGCYRDMASMHGSYRKVEETIPAVEMLGDLLAEYDVARCHWLLDQPVSNSGRLKTMLRELSGERGWQWEIELVANPDTVLTRTSQIVASADGQVLDQVQRWFNLARMVIDQCLPDTWIVNLCG